MDRKNIIGLAFFAFTVMTAFSQENSCGRLLCNNRGSCSADSYGGIVRSGCKCSDEWTGRNCEIPRCVSNTNCRNGGTCSDGKCTCVHGYAGYHCENTVTACINEICQNGGTCVYDNSYEGYHCVCPKRFGGPFCDRVSCFEEPGCQHGGRCLLGLDGEDPFKNYYTKCYCKAGYYGGLCEHEDLCRSSPCLNGGTCKLPKYQGRYECQCPGGYKGIHCEIDACNSSPCINGGTCKHSQVAFVYKCLCPEKTKGSICQQTVCQSSPCLNGGTCWNRDRIDRDGRNFECQCPKSFVGPYCQGQLCGGTNGECSNGKKCVRDSLFQYCE